MRVKSTEGKKSVKATGASPSKRTESAFTLSPEPLTGPTASQETAKYDLGVSQAQETPQPSSTQPEYENLGNLPATYGQNSLYLVARDPHWLFCYWDIDWSALASEIKDAPIYLRLLKEDGIEIEKVVVNPHAPNWYLPAPGQGAAYFVEIGSSHSATGWNCLCQSDLAFVPEQAISQETNEEFATVPLHLSFQRLLDAVHDAMRGGESLLHALSRMQGTGLLSFGGKEVIKWTPDQRQVLEALLGQEMVEKISLGSGEFEKVLRRDLESSLSSDTSSGIRGRSLRLPETGPTSLSSGFGSSWSAQPFSRQQDRGFFMHVNAEVIFYGGTDPDATVTINGEPITLSPDGSFRYHFLFPDESYEVPIEATSPDGLEKRSAVLRFERSTSRKGDVGHTAQPAELTTPKGKKS